MADTITSPRQVDLEADLAAPRGMMLAIGQVHPSKDNLRRMGAGAEADRQMQESVAAAGIYTPIIVRPLPSCDGWEVIDGHRRYSAALAAGMSHIPAIVRASNDAEQLALQAAANIVRAPLAAIDQWRAMVQLQERGFTLADAGHMLGFEDRFARRLSLLGKLHPKILAEIEREGLPSQAHLATIASAPAKVQTAALKASGVWIGGKPARLSWHDLAIACMRTRIPQARAIFDVAASKVVFEEDLFASPGAEDQFTTTNVTGFMKAQQAALDARADGSKGKIQAVEWDEKHGQPALPKGWLAYAYGPKPRGLVSFQAIVPTGYCMGEVRELPAAPKPKPEPKKLAAEPVVVEDAEEAAPPPASARGPITQTGLQLLAQAQTEAIRTRLRTQGPSMDEGELLELLLLALCGKNVRIEGERREQWNITTSFQDLAAQLLDEDGEQRELEPGDGRRLAAEAIARIVVVTPVGGHAGSGRPAHWIGRWIDAAEVMPRLDTPEFLATLSQDTLRACAQELHKPNKGTAKALREQLANRSPKLTVPEALFHAAGPTPVASPTEED
jgi:ParB/RepB/Spo0J family partition protein